MDALAFGLESFILLRNFVEHSNNKLEYIFMTLSQLLEESEESDAFEELVEDFLYSKGVQLVSHSREIILKLAWRNGWRPQGMFAS